MAMRSAQRSLAEAYPARHVLGVGVSHSGHVEPRGHTYAAPVGTATAYLNAMNESSYVSPDPGSPLTTLLAALGPRMLAVSGDGNTIVASYFNNRVFELDKSGKVVWEHKDALHPFRARRR